MATQLMQKKMLEYFGRLNTAEQKSVLQLVKTFAERREDDFNPQTIEEYNRELDEANARIDAGEFVTHEEVMKKYFL